MDLGKTLEPPPRPPSAAGTSWWAETELVEGWEMPDRAGGRDRAGRSLGRGEGGGQSWRSGHE